MILECLFSIVGCIATESPVFVCVTNAKETLATVRTMDKVADELRKDEVKANDVAASILAKDGFRVFWADQQVDAHPVAIVFREKDIGISLLRAKSQLLQMLLRRKGMGECLKPDDVPEEIREQINGLAAGRLTGRFQKCLVYPVKQTILEVSGPGRTQNVKLTDQSRDLIAAYGDKRLAWQPGNDSTKGTVSLPESIPEYQFLLRSKERLSSLARVRIQTLAASFVEDYVTKIIEKTRSASDAAMAAWEASAKSAAGRLRTGDAESWSSFDQTTRDQILSALFLGGTDAASSISAYSFRVRDTGFFLNVTFAEPPAVSGTTGATTMDSISISLPISD